MDDNGQHIHAEILIFSTYGFPKNWPYNLLIWAFFIIRLFDKTLLFQVTYFRLLHWASKEIDPVGVDYVLQKLGFTHARVTIPKWMQRGFMDPLDKFLSILIEYLITVLREKPKEQTEGES